MGLGGVHKHRVVLLKQCYMSSTPKYETVRERINVEK